MTVYTSMEGVVCKGVDKMTAYTSMEGVCE